MGLAFTMTFGGFTSKKLGKFDPNLGHFIHGVFRTKNTLTRLDAFFAIFPANFCKSWLMVLFCGRFRMFQKWCVFSFFEFGDDFEKGDHIMLVPRKEVCHFFQPREKVHHTQLPNGYLVTFFPSWKWNRKMILPWEMIWHFESMDFLCLSQINHNPYDPCDWYMYLYIYHWRKVDHVMWVNIPVPWILWVIILFLFLRPTFTLTYSLEVEHSVRKISHPERNGSSSNHHFAGATCLTFFLNFGGVAWRYTHFPLNHDYGTKGNRGELLPNFGVVLRGPP